MPYKNLIARRKNGAQKRRAIVLKLREIKRRLGCARCPEIDPVCLDFHHRDEEKKLFTIGLHPWSRAWAKVLIEIEKCICLCANCHRKEEDKRRAERGDMDQYEVIIRATVAIEAAKDETDAAEQAIQNLDRCSGTGIVNLSVSDTRKIDA